MIEHVRGNLLEADVEALVNTVNTVGIMGKGIALQFRQAFPENYDAYRKACQHGQVKLGRMFVFRTGRWTNPRFIINFPTKGHWKGKTRIEDVKAGLLDLVSVLKENDIRSVAVPPLGCGNGGLDWQLVRPLIESALAMVPNTYVLLYGPAGAPDVESMPVSTTRPNMTLARAVILALMSRYAVPGYRLSLLEIQKLAYLVQEAGQPLKLQYAKRKYGPYAENLQHALQRMEGHFIRGYGDRTRDASVRPLPDALPEAERFLHDHPVARACVDKVSQLIDGLESPYGMELLATIHYLAKENPDVRQDAEKAVDGVYSWNEHKRQTFQRKHIEAVWARLHEQGWI